MVILKLMGGLGNQMFQLAAGRCLAKRLGCDLLIDYSDFEQFQKRQFSLASFCIDGAFSRSNVPVVGASQIVKKRLPWLWLHWRNANRYFYFRERQFHFDAFFNRIKGNVILVGHWNSERYFAEIRQDVVDMFQLKREAFEHLDPGLVGRLREGGSVAIHVRRGDYVTEAKASQVHGFIGLDYYRSAVEELRRRVPSPRYYVFSDDKDWVRAHFSFLGDYQIVDEAENHKDFEDLTLMSLCHHNIIANSTFSWWGGYLNANPDKIVIAPKQWFRDPSKDTRDLFVDGWTVI